MTFASSRLGLRWAAAVRRRFADERGTVLVLVGILLPVLLGIAALVIDVGSWYQQKQQMQAAADAAALAGAQDLPRDPSTAQSDARAYAAKNIAGATVTPVTPYNSDPSQIQVTVSKPASTFFGSVLGIGAPTIKVIGVAKANAKDRAMAVFAADTNCSDAGFDMPGSSNTILGPVRSNGTFHIVGAGNAFGPTTVGGPNNCPYQVSDRSNTFDGSPTPVVDTSTVDWPLDYRNMLPACTYSADPTGCSACDHVVLGDVSWSNQLVPSGIWCVTGQIKVNGNTSGNLTLIAPNISFIGAGQSITPYFQGLLAFDTSTAGLSIPGSAIQGGTLFAPYANISIPGSSSTFTGFAEALNITIPGSGNTFTGTGPALGGAATDLVQ